MAKYNIPFDIAIEYNTRDLKKMKFQDLQRTAAALAREARERVSDLEAMEEEYGESPTLRAYRRFREGERYSARYKGRDALMQEISDLKNFLDNETGTREGYMDFIHELDQEVGYEMTKENRTAYYAAFRELSEFMKNSKIFFESDNLFEQMKYEAAADRNKYTYQDNQINWYSVRDAIITRYGGVME